MFSSQLQPRKKLLKLGLENLTELDLLRLIIGSGSTRSPSKTLAEQVYTLLFPSKHTVSNLKQLPNVTLLMNISGIGLAQAARILASLEFGRRLFQPRHHPILTSTDVLAQLSIIRTKQREHLMALYLNARQELIHQEIISIGSLNTTAVQPRDIFAPAFLYNAGYFIIAHNHPSGVVQPSEEDLTVTTQLAQACNLLGIQLLDHMIVTSDEHFSFREQGYL